MAVVSVEVPDSIAKKLWNNIIEYNFFIKQTTWFDVDEIEWWVDYKVNMSGKDFLDTIKKEIL